MSLPDIPDFLRADAKDANQVATRRPGFVSNVIEAIDGGNSRWRQFTSWLERHVSFWPFVLTVAVLSAVYFYVIAEPLYVSTTVISLRSKSQSVPSVGGILSGLMGGETLTGQNAALVDHIQSYEMLSHLDKKFHLRARWSSPERNIFERLSANASDENFRNYYLSMINVSLQPDTGLIEVDVDGFTPEEATEMNGMIISESETFMNAISDSIQRATLRFAEIELRAASHAVATAQPIEQDYSERRLTAAQEGMATALGLASQQQVFLVRVSGPNLPTKATLPLAFLDTLALTLLAAIIYVIGYLLWSNVRDHRSA